MRDEKVFRVGRVLIDGDLIEFHAEPTLSFAAGRRDVITLGVAYEYREASEDKEVATIRISAHLDGQRPETHEAVIHDNPLANDSRRGFLSVPVRVSGTGTVRGRFAIEARYGAGPWRKPIEREVEGRHEGEFVLNIQ